MRRNRLHLIEKGQLESMFELPNWIFKFYASIALLLIPWILLLSYNLPTRHIVVHWDVAWAGFDVGLLVAVALTAYLAFRRSGWSIFGFISTGTLLLIDAWFDTLTARNGLQMSHSVLLAIAIELPLSALSFWLAFRITKQMLDLTLPSRPSKPPR